MNRDAVLSLLAGEKISRLPVFGVLPSLTAQGIQSIGARYSELHTDAAKMADAAASTFELYGYGCAIVPFDLCVESEALGCAIDFQTEVDSFIAPAVANTLDLDSWAVADLRPAASAARIPLVGDAIRRLKKRVGDRVAVGAWIPGPFTLAWQMFGADAWLSAVGSQEVGPILQRLAEWLSLIANSYRDAGADFVTVHEMGASPQIIGPEKFRSMAKPALRMLFSRMPSPNVLSVCGDTNAIVRDLAECGASAINVDHCNDLARTRQILGPDAILLGNLDPVGVLSRGTVKQVRHAVEEIVRAGASAIVPGCDLYPDIPDENMRVLLESSRRF